MREKTLDVRRTDDEVKLHSWVGSHGSSPSS